MPSPPKPSAPAVATAQAATAPVILKANSTLIDMRDGDRLLGQEWAIDPAIALDADEASRTGAAKTVSFISPIDSVSFRVEAGRTYDYPHWPRLVTS